MTPEVEKANATAHSQKMVDWVQLLRVPEGKLAGKPLRLLPFQRRFIHDVYGPRHPDGRRKVREAVKSIPRKNGKSGFSAALCLAHLCGPEMVLNAQLYSAAQDRDQASLIFNLASRMVRMHPTLADAIRVLESKKSLIHDASGNAYKALSAEVKTKLGFSTAFCIFDELAQAGTDRKLYDALRTSSAAHDNPLFITISTQAADDAALLSELIDYGLEYPDDEAFYLMLYAAPKDADIWDEKVWYDCNPALGKFRSLEEFRELADRAKRLPSLEAALRNYYLNQRISSEAPFVSPSLWKANGGKPNYDPSLVWYGGLDLSTKLDLTAFVLVSLNEDGTVNVACWHWTPKDTLADRAHRDRAPYELWAKQGYLTTVPGTSIDYGFVAAKLGEIAQVFNIEEIYFDRYRIDDLNRELNDQGVDLPLVECGQGYKDFNPCVEALEELIHAQMLRHGMNPVLTQAIANIAVDMDPAGNRKFTKKKARGRIDGAVALAMAARALGVEERSVLNDPDYQIMVLG